MESLTDKRNSQLYLGWLLLAISYGIAFGQRVAPQSIVNDLGTDFNARAVEVGVLASGYFYGYLLMQVPAGILVDTLGVRRVMVASLVVSMIGTVLFALSGDLTSAFMSRICIACSDAVVFVALLKFVAKSFANRRFGLMSGLSQLSGYVGGVVATMPLAYAARMWGWRPMFLLIAAVLGITALLLFLVIEDDHPDGDGADQRRLLSEIWGGTRSALISMWKFLGTRETWGSAVCFATYFIPAMSISGVWGSKQLTEGMGMAPASAAIMLSLVLLATMAGSVAGGYLSDVIADRLSGALSLCATVRTLCLALMAPALGIWFGLAGVAAALVLFGFVGGVTLPLVFRTIKNHYNAAHIGIGVAINSTLAGVCAGAAQPIIGAALDGDSWTRGLPFMGFDLVAAFMIATSIPGIVAPYWKRRQISGSEGREEDT